VDLVMKPMTSSADSVAALTGTVTGRPAQTIQGKSLPMRRVSLVFEFLDERGKVVTTSPAEIAELEPGQTVELAVEVQGRGIVAWRYTFRQTTARR
jgi:hypothetical protein